MRARDQRVQSARERPQAPCKRATERSEALSESQETSAYVVLRCLSELIYWR